MELQLTRERDQIVAERSAIKNQLHAETIQAKPNTNSVRRLKERIAFLNRQEKEIKGEIDVIIDNNEDVKKEVKNIISIPGIGKLTAVIVLAETNGFELIRNKKQLTSYAVWMLRKNNQAHLLEENLEYPKREIEVCVKQCICHPCQQ